MQYQADFRSSTGETVIKKMDPSSPFVLGPAADTIQCIDGATSLFVGNLNDCCTDADLMNLFSKHGTVLYVRIMKTRKNTTLGYAFATMQTAAEAEQAIKALDNTMLHDRALRISLAARCVLGNSTTAPSAAGSARAMGPSTIAFRYFQLIDANIGYIPVTEAVIRHIFDLPSALFTNEISENDDYSSIKEVIFNGVSRTNVSY